MGNDPVTTALVAAMRANFLAARQLERVEKVLAGLTLAAMPPRKLSQLTARLYAARGTYDARELFPWEADWLDADLPSPPARVLIGGAGSGREVVALLQSGYEVVAFDPASSYVAHAKKHIQGAGLRAYACGAYEDLLCPDHRLTSLVAEHAPYDAILLGWGSFTHMPLPKERAALLQRLMKLCPSGPLLLSFWLRHERAPETQARAFRLGWRLGSFLAGRPHEEEPIAGDRIMARCGYGHSFTIAEVAALAAGANYELHRTPGPHQAYAHATLMPLQRPSPSDP